MFRETLSPTALEACAIVDQIRFEEQQTLWTPEYEDSLVDSAGDIYPGMMFILAKERMEKSKLWQIVRRMPKGALLHCHSVAMVDMDWLIATVCTADGMYIKAPAPLHTTEALEKTPFTFQYSKRVLHSADVLIWSESYESDALTPVKVAAEAFKGGQEAFAKWLRSRLTVTAEESLKHHHGVNEIWRKFTSIFPILHSLLRYEWTFREFIRRMIRQLHDDGVRWVDIRHTFVLPFVPDDSDEPDDDYINYFRVLDEEIEAFKASEDGKDFWGARVIWTSIRRLSNKMIVEGKSSSFPFC